MQPRPKPTMNSHRLAAANRAVAVDKPTKNSSAGQLLQWILRKQADAILALDEPLRELQPDSVHQMRVACRRLRTQLRIFHDLLYPEWTVWMRQELQWLANSLAKTRDLEVLRERLPKTAQADPVTPIGMDQLDQLIAHFVHDELAEVDAVLAALHSSRYNRLADQLAFINECEFTALAAEPLTTVMPPIVASVGRRFRRKANKLSLTASDEQWHQVRIRAKQARYAIEPLAPLFGQRAQKGLKRITAVQRILGDHQDAVVMFHTLLEIGAESNTAETELTLACGRLAERERVNATQSRREFLRMWQHLRGTTSLWWLQGR